MSNCFLHPQGIYFYDITTLLLNPTAFQHVIDMFSERYQGQKVDVIAGEQVKLPAASISAPQFWKDYCTTQVALAPEQRLLRLWRLPAARPPSCITHLDFERYYTFARPCRL